MSQYFGKYRGKVVNNIDPLMLGRVQVSVPSVTGDDQLGWAMPCVPYAGSGVGLFLVPPVGANVWVEFEEGNIDHPILAGCFWGDGEMPASPALPTTMILKTDCISIKLDNLQGAGGLTIDVQPPAVTTPLTLVMDSSGITLTNSSAKVALTPASVSINDGALEVI